MMHFHDTDYINSPNVLTENQFSPHLLISPVGSSKRCDFQILVWAVRQEPSQATFAKSRVLPAWVCSKTPFMLYPVILLLKWQQLLMCIRGPRGVPKTWWVTFCSRLVGCQYSAGWLWWCCCLLRSGAQSSVAQVWGALLSRMDGEGR